MYTAKIPRLRFTPLGMTRAVDDRPYKKDALPIESVGAIIDRLQSRAD